VKVVVLAGGLGSRLAEETETRPKAMVEIGGRPILWHILKHFDHYGFREFLIAVGYRGEVIKRYFLDHSGLSGSMTIDLLSGGVKRHEERREEWIVHLIETGSATMTGGRVKRLAPWLVGQTFMLTYGDGVSDVNLQSLLEFHKRHGRMATVTAVRPPARFGGLVFDGNRVVEFTEKAQIGEGWINGGYMVFEPEVIQLLGGDETVLEADILELLAERGQLMAYRHESFWQCMDTLRDKRLLDGLWERGDAPWKIWE